MDGLRARGLMDTRYGWVPDAFTAAVHDWVDAGLLYASDSEMRRIELARPQDARQLLKGAASVEDTLQLFLVRGHVDDDLGCLSSGAGVT